MPLQEHQIETNNSRRSDSDSSEIKFRFVWGGFRVMFPLRGALGPTRASVKF